ncbi:MAG: hypothetical protein QF733_02515 [Phycisphaerales bacterium]|nr:hypothetical protein [Phycisphaerales bacterium]
MRRTSNQHVAWTVAYAAACNAALTVVLTRHLGSGATLLWGELPAMLAIPAAAGAAVGLVGHGATLNNLLDRHRDAAVTGAAPRSAIGPDVIVLVGSLILAVMMSAVLGPDATWVVIVLASLLLFHSAVARFIPAIGLAVPGALMAGAMLVPDWRMPMPLAVWLAMSIGVLGAIGVHILGDKRPVLSARALLMVVMMWIVMSGVVLGLRGAVEASMWPEGMSMVVLAWPLLAVLLLGVALRWTLPRASGRRDAADRAVRVLALWQPLIGAAWCLSVGAEAAAAVFGGIWVLGLAVSAGSRDLMRLPAGSEAWR